jgi:hypothetical protein
MMKKLLLILTLISLTPQISAMYQEREDLTVGEIQECICAENKRKLDKRMAENKKIDASKKNMYGALLTAGFVALAATQIIYAVNKASNNNQ